MAIIQNGSLPEEKVGIATVSTMAEMAENEQLGSPAIIVIGEVVHARSDGELQHMVYSAVQYAYVPHSANFHFWKIVLAWD